MGTTTMDDAYIGQPAAADTTIYGPVAANTKVRVIKCTATNDTTTAVTISFNKVLSGGAVGPANLILNLKALGSRETYECPEVVGQVLKTGGFMSSICSVANQVTVAFDVVEIV